MYRAALAIGGIERFALYNAPVSEELKALEVSVTAENVIPAF